MWPWRRCTKSVSVGMYAATVFICAMIGGKNATDAMQQLIRQHAGNTCQASLELDMPSMDMISPRAIALLQEVLQLDHSQPILELMQPSYALEGAVKHDQDPGRHITLLREWTGENALPIIF